MAIYTTIIHCEDDGSAHSVETVEYEGKLWIVPRWIEGPIPGTIAPERIICVDGLVQKTGPHLRADYFLPSPLSRDILEGRRISQDHAVIERPDIVRKVDKGL
jgi:hypothetical protein